MPSEDHHEVPQHSVLDSGSKAYAPKTCVPGLVTFAWARANVSIVGDHHPSSGGNDGNPVRIVLRHDVERRSTTPHDDITAQPHERDPESTEILVDEETCLIKARRAHATPPSCIWALVMGAGLPAGRKGDQRSTPVDRQHDGLHRPCVALVNLGRARSDSGELESWVSNGISRQARNPESARRDGEVSVNRADRHPQAITRPPNAVSLHDARRTTIPPGQRVHVDLVGAQRGQFVE